MVFGKKLFSCFIICIIYIHAQKIQASHATILKAQEKIKKEVKDSDIDNKVKKYQHKAVIVKGMQHSKKQTNAAQEQYFPEDVLPIADIRDIIKSYYVDPIDFYSLLVNPPSSFLIHEEMIRSLTISNDGTRLISCAADDTHCKVWNVHRKPTIVTLDETPQQLVAPQPQQIVRLTNNNQFLLTKTPALSFIWDVSKKNILEKKSYEEKLMMNADGMLVIEQDPKQLVIKSLSPHRRSTSITGTAPFAMFYLSDFNLLATESEQGEVKLWGIEKDTGNNIILKHKHTISPLSKNEGLPALRMISKNGHYILRQAGEDNFAIESDTDVRYNYEIPASDAYRPTTIFGNQDNVLIVNYSNRIDIFNLFEKKLLHSMPLQKQPMFLMISGDDKILGVVTEDDTVRIWDISTGALLYQCQPQGTIVTGCINKDGSSIILGFRDGTIKIYALNLAVASQLKNLTLEQLDFLKNLALSNAIVEENDNDIELKECVDKACHQVRVKIKKPSIVLTRKADKIFKTLPSQMRKYLDERYTFNRE